MNLITIEQARKHVKADGDDDDLLTVYCNGAEKACARLANRNLYKTQNDLTAALAALPAAMTAAWTTYDAAMEAANALDDPRAIEYGWANAAATLQDVQNQQDAVLHGMVATDDIIMAVLMTVGHAYRNRESVVTGQGAAAVEVPQSAAAIMSLNRWIGPL